MNDIQIKLNNIFTIFDKTNAPPQIELHYMTDFELLISIILSAQATDISVNKATSKLYSIANTPQQILDLGLENLLTHLSTLNLYKTKSKHVIETSKILVEKYNSQVPQSFDDLLTLPGVGRKTANVFLSTFYGEFRIGIDTHITRVVNRLGLANTTNVTIIEKILTENIPERWRGYCHHWLVLHGRYICKARKPLCDICPINAFCDYYTSIKSSS